MKNTRSFRRPQQDSHLHKKNEEIKAPFVTLVTEDGEKIENCPTSEALKTAYDSGLDLVLVAPNLNPPVAKIMDWGKYKYEQTKKLEQSKKGQKSAELKEIRLRPKTGPHDLEIKMKKMREFLEKGHKVKMSMMFKGREAAYLNNGREALMSIISKLSDISTVDDKVSYQFKRLSVTLSPIKQDVKKEAVENK